MASLRPSVSRASVRAPMTNSGFWRASRAARIFSVISARETTRLPAKWPQRLGSAWSSIRMPAAPASSKRRTLRQTWGASAPPVSPSTITGTLTRSVMRCTSSAISEWSRKPRSGRPRRLAAMPKPPRKSSSTPARSITRAEKASYGQSARISPGLSNRERRRAGADVGSGTRSFRRITDEWPHAVAECGPRFPSASCADSAGLR